VNGDSIDSLLSRADAALYAAKSGGRNCVVVADPEISVPGYGDADRLVRSPTRPQIPVSAEVNPAARHSRLRSASG
jgi:hypothetical protein